MLRPDIVTLSAVFPPPPPVDAGNFVQFRSLAQPSLEAFPPAPAQTTGSQAQVAPTSSATTTPSQQEQLAQLDRVLERLGINPQSISLDNRLALIKSANDPPALLNLVRTLGLNQAATTSQQTSALNATNLSNPALTGAQTQAPVQNESQTKSPPASISPLQSSSPPAGSGFEAALQANPGAASSEGPATSASNGAAQFKQLQAVLQGAENAQNPQGSTGEHVAPTASLSILV